MLPSPKNSPRREAEGRVSAISPSTECMNKMTMIPTSYSSVTRTLHALFTTPHDGSTHDHLCLLPLLYCFIIVCETYYHFALATAEVHFPSMALFTRTDRRRSSRVITPLFVAGRRLMVWMEAHLYDGSAM